MANDSSTGEVCPFWSMPTMKCQLCREGLFIPLNDHIELYCRSAHYPQCLQFSLHAADHRKRDGKNCSNRRKYERVAVSHRVSLVELAPMEHATSRLSAADNAGATGRTLDLGKGGMRLATEQPLPKAAAIRFSFEGSFPKGVQSGEGHVAWCRKQKNIPEYQIGIAFRDDRLVDTMGLYLGLIASAPDYS